MVDAREKFGVVLNFWIGGFSECAVVLFNRMKNM